MTEPERFTVTLPDGDVAAISFGDPARPVDVIFSHATGFNALTYRQSLSALADRLHIVAIDQRGHGRTTLPADPEHQDSWTPFADDLIAVMDWMNLTRPVVLAGHSMGGTVSMLAAARLGEQVKGLVLFDPVMMRGLGVPTQLFTSPLVDGARRRRRAFDSKAAVLEAYLGRGAFKSWPPEAVADYVEDGFKSSPEGGVVLSCAPEWEAIVFAGQKHDAWAPLETITAPIHVLRAEHGSTCTLDLIQARVDGHHERRLDTIAGSSHFLPMERPDLVAAALEAACA